MKNHKTLISVKNIPTTQTSNMEKVLEKIFCLRGVCHLFKVSHKVCLAYADVIKC